MLLLFCQEKKSGLFRPPPRTRVHDFRKGQFYLTMTRGPSQPPTLQLFSANTTTALVSCGAERLFIVMHHGGLGPLIVGDIGPNEEYGREGGGL